MPSLDYGKWDTLELSDDSDFEGHPNVDKRALINYKKNEIHSRREQRRQKIAQLQSNIEENATLISELEGVRTTLGASETPRQYLNSLVQAQDALGSRVQQITDSVNDDGDFVQTVTEKINEEIQKIKDTMEQDRVEAEQEQKERKKKLTSEDIKDGFSSVGTLSRPAKKPAPVPKKVVTEYEVLNAPKPESPMPDTLSPSLEGFSKIAPGNFEESYKYIQNHDDIVVDGQASIGALQVTAFRAQMAGQSNYALQCVHQSMILEYCARLSQDVPDGTMIFFRQMIHGTDSNARQATLVFNRDVQITFELLVRGVNNSRAEFEEVGREEIQIVPEDPNEKVSFDIPAVDSNDPRWQAYDRLPTALKEAIAEGTLDKVNQVLSDMHINIAELVVNDLKNAKILSFSDGGIRDETGIGRAEAGL